jgi:8-oxo-dGTP diphosphatase
MIFKNPNVTADLIVVRKLNNQVQFLAIQRGKAPFKGKFALPGGHLEYGKETLEDTGVRELREETGLKTKKKHLRLIGTYSWPNRDPRGHYVTAAFLVTKFRGSVVAGDDAKTYKWLPLNNPPRLAFDHDCIIKDFKRWRKKFSLYNFRPWKRSENFLKK